MRQTTMSTLRFSALAVAVFGPIGCSKPSPALVACTPPLASWGKAQNFRSLTPTMNKIALDREGKIYWNGKTLSFDALSKVMAQAHSLGPEPLTVFETEMGAPCKAVDAIRIEMERRLACGEDGPCFEGIMTVWRELPSPVGRPPS